MSGYRRALRSYGLNEKEVIVYLACMGQNSCSAQEIADRTEFSRQVVYDTMKRLIHDGLIATFHAGSSLRYQSTTPQRLLQNLEQKAEVLKKALPEIERLRQFATTPATTELHTGVVALRNVLRDALTNGQEILLMTDHTQAHELFLEHDFYNMTLKRIETRTPIKTLISSAEMPLKERSIWATDHASFRETRTSSTLDGVQTTILIYGKTVVLMDMCVTSPHAVLVRDPQIAEAQRRLFMHVWNDASSLRKHHTRQRR